MSNQVYMAVIAFTTDFFYLFICVMFLNKFLGTLKFHRTGTVVGVTLLIVCKSVFGCLFLFNIFYLIVSTLLLNVLLAFLFYKSRSPLKIFTVSVLCGAGFISGILTASVLVYIGISQNKLMPDKMLIKFEGMVIALLIFFFITNIFSYKKNKAYDIQVKYYILLLFIPVVSAIIVYQFAYNAPYYGNGFSITIVLSVLGILVVNGILFFLYEMNMRQSAIRLRYRLAEQQLEIQIRHYNQLLENRELVMEMLHDVNKHLLLIDSLASSGDFESIQSYIDHLNLNAHKFSKTAAVNTGHPVIDAVLEEKRSISEKNGIEMNISVLLPPDVGIDNVDICIVLGNALDNAIEACNKIDTDKLKEINVKLGESNNYFVISVTNTKKGDAGVSQNSYETTKSDREFHGFGLHNIRSTVEKYEGNVQIINNSDYFTLNAVMRLQSNQKAVVNI